MDLRFLRDMDRREVDFVVLEEGKHLFAVECKAGEKNINPALYYFRERTELPGFYQVHEGKRDFEKNGVRVLPERADNDQEKDSKNGLSQLSDRKVDFLDGIVRPEPE